MPWLYACLVWSPCLLAHLFTSLPISGYLPARLYAPLSGWGYLPVCSLLCWSWLWHLKRSILVSALVSAVVHYPVSVFVKLCIRISLVCQPAFCQLVSQVFASWIRAFWCLLNACWCLPSVSLSAFCQFVCLVSASWMPAWCLPSVKLYTVMICTLYCKCTVRSRSVGYFWTVISIQ